MRAIAVIEEFAKLCVAVVLFVAGLLGCATVPERHLTAEQDADMAARCAHGCAIVPAPIWQQILDALADKGVRL